MYCLVNFWRRKEIEICVCINDGLVSSSTSNLALQEAEFIKKMLDSVRFYYKFQQISLAIAKKAYWIGNSNKFDKILFYYT